MSVKIDGMVCDVCGKRAIGWNKSGPFCEDRNHYHVSPDYLEWHRKLMAFLRGEGPSPAGRVPEDEQKA